MGKTKATNSVLKGERIQEHQISQRVIVPLNRAEEKKVKGDRGGAGGEFSGTLLTRSCEEEKRLRLGDGRHLESQGRRVETGESLGFTHQPA